MGVHTYPKGICPKVNVTARLEYELTNYDSAVHRFNHYTTRTPPETITHTDNRQSLAIPAQAEPLRRSLELVAKGIDKVT